MDLPLLPVKHFVTRSIMSSKYIFITLTAKQSKFLSLMYPFQVIHYNTSQSDKKGYHDHKEHG